MFKRQTGTGGNGDFWEENPGYGWVRGLANGLGWSWLKNFTP